MEGVEYRHVVLKGKFAQGTPPIVLALDPAAGIYRLRSDITQASVSIDREEVHPPGPHEAPNGVPERRASSRGAARVRGAAHQDVHLGTRGIGSHQEPAGVGGDDTKVLRSEEQRLALGRSICDSLVNP
eukprot:6076211-Pyramimonas_sp.AAC.1